MIKHTSLDNTKVIEFIESRLTEHLTEAVYLVRDFHGVLTIIATPSAISENLLNDLKDEYSPWIGTRLLPQEVEELIPQLVEDSERIEKKNCTYYWTERLPHLGSWLNPKKLAPSRERTAVIVAFYSYKGGVGRSTLAAATAFALSSDNHRVLLIDADFEAPGVPSYFYPSSHYPDYNPAEGAKGLVEYLNLVHTSKITRQDRVPSITPFLFGNDQYYPNLSFIAAGDLANPTNYANEVARVNFNDHSKSALIQLLKNLGTDFEIIIFDARTGLTDAGGLITNILADFAVFVGYPDDQTAHGLRFFAKNLVPQRDEDNVLKIPAMWVHSPAQKRDGVVDAMEHERFRNAVAVSLSTASDLEESEIAAILAAEDMPAIVAVPYQDDIRSAVRVAGISALRNYQQVWSSVQVIEERIKSLLAPVQSKEPASKNNVFNTILTELKQASQERPINPTADDMTKHDFVADFLPLDGYQSAFDNRRFLILGRKGMGKTTLERLLNLFHAELDQDDFAHKLIGGHHTSGRIKYWRSVVSVENYHSFAKLNGAMEDWKDFTFERFWALTLEACLLHGQPPTDSVLESCLTAATKSDQHATIMKRLDDAFANSSELTLTFDGLDEAFPLPAIRRPAIGALIQIFWRARNSDKPNVHAKIFYRTDLFDNEFSHPNKGHMKTNGAVTLEWKFEELQAVMLKSLFSRSATLVDEVQERLGRVIRKSNSLGFIPDARDEAWLTAATRLVFGERITQPYAEAFLKRYLRDGNDRYFPRFAMRFLKGLIDHARAGTTSVFDTYHAIKRVYWQISSEHLEMELLEMHKDLIPVCRAIQADPSEAKPKLKSRNEFQAWLTHRLQRPAETVLSQMVEAGLIAPYGSERNAPIKFPDMYRVPLGISLTNGLPPKSEGG